MTTSAKILKNYAKKVVLVWTGVCSVIFGIAGTILPIVPGLVFIFAGLILMSRGSATIRNFFLMEIILTETRKRVGISNNVALKRLITLL